MGKVTVGIDFGTCNIKVAKWNEKKKEVSSIKLGKVQRSSDNTIPNVIYYEKNNYIVGDPAKQKSKLDNDNSIELIKRKLEIENWKKFIPNINKELSAIDIATDIFRWIFDELKSKSNDDIYETIITVPVCYSEVQKHRIKHCAENAGFIVKEVIIEPLAALFFDEELFDEDICETVFVFDFGGGTLDLSIANIESDEDESVVKVLGSSGIRLGGTDITKVLFDGFIKENFDICNPNIDLSNYSKEELKILYDEILEQIEESKQNLFSDDEDEIEDFFVSKKGDNITIEFSKDDVYRWLDETDFKERVIELIEKLIDDSRIDKEDITKIKLVGGTSRMDYFQNIIHEFFDSDDDILDLDDLDNDDIYCAVSSGAVRYIKFTENKDLEFENRTPFSIGYSLDNKFESLISKNAKYGFVSPKKNLKSSSLDENKYMKIYQLFQKKNGLSITDETVVYAGYFEIDKNKYSNDDSILFEVQINENGDIIGSFYDYNDGEINLCEKLKLKVGE